MTRVELEGGLYTDPAKAAARRPRLQAILDAIPTLPFDEAAAQAYGAILKSTGYSRRKILDWISRPRPWPITPASSR